MSSNLKIPKNCLHCKNVFTAGKTTTKFCSHTCASRAYKQKKRDEKVKATLQETQQSLQTQQTANPQTISAKEYLSIADAAALLGASRWTIQRMIKRDQLKVAKIGSRTIISRISIDNLFN